MSSTPSRIKSFEGLKGFSVLVVILYHLFPGIFPGGFLMVNTFLVLGGYFFAYKMEQLFAQNQPMDWSQLGHYMLRTCERLILPLLWMMMLIVVGLLIVDPTQLHYLRSDIFTSLFFVNNWYQILTEKSYFVKMTNATPFTHLWYNAIYFQSFLLAIPLFFATRKLKLSLPAKGIFWFVLVAVSHALIFFFYDGKGDPSRVYYGLDTRFSSFALGIATAYSLPAILNYVHGLKNRKRIFTILGVLMTAATVILVMTVKDSAPETYLLVMPYFNLLSMALIWLITTNPPVTRYFWGNPVLDFLGHRSYSYYLWYYPVIVFYMGQFRNFDGNMPLINSLIGVTILVLGELLYRLVERPSFTVPFGNHLRWVQDGRLLRQLWYHKQWKNPALLSGFVFLLTFVFFGIGLAQTKDNKRVALFELEYKTFKNMPNLLDSPYPAEKEIVATKKVYAEAMDKIGPVQAVEDPIKRMLKNYTKAKENEYLVGQLVNVQKDKIEAFLKQLKEAEGELEDIKAMHPIVAEELSDQELLFATQVPMTLFGDSIVGINGLNTLDVFKSSNYYGQGSLQIWDAIPIFQKMVDEGKVKKNVVINLGTNASLDRPALDDMIRIAGDRQVFFINTNSRVQHIAEVNRLIKEVAAAYPNVHEIDWYTYSQGHPEWYGEDEIHHSIEGMEHFTIIIAKVMYETLNKP